LFSLESPLWIGDKKNTECFVCKIARAVLRKDTFNLQTMSEFLIIVLKKQYIMEEK